MLSLASSYLQKEIAKDKVSKDQMNNILIRSKFKASLINFELHSFPFFSTISFSAQEKEEYIQFRDKNSPPSEHHCKYH